MSAEVSAPGRPQVGLGQLRAMFSSLPANCVEDVLRQCGDDGEKALEALLCMNHSSPRGLPSPTSNRELLATLFPPERTPGPPALCLAAAADWATDQDALLAAPWLSPGFGNFPALHTLADAPLGCHQEPQSREWWPQWEPGITQPHPQPAFEGHEDFDLNSNAYPELPSEEGWACESPAFPLETNSGSTSQSQSPPTTPLQCRNGTPVGQDATDSPELSDNELCEAFPGLAPLLGTPSLSGSTSPARNPSPPSSARRCASQPDSLPSALHLDNMSSSLDPSLFPNLGPEIVADILQRYDAATALKHLRMLSSAVAEADTTPEDKEVPDEASWCYDGGLAGNDEAETASISSDDDMPPLQKLELLKLQFPSLSATEVASVLQACDNHLHNATQLLGRFSGEDAGAEAQLATAMAEETASALTSLSLDSPTTQSAPGQLAKVEQLAKCFPEVSEESLKIVLVSVGDDIAAAHKVLLDQGFTEVVAGTDTEPAPVSHLPCTSHIPPPPLAPTPVPLSTSPPKPAPASLSELTYQRNQQIYEEERMQQNRLLQARRKCRELAAEHRQRGEYALADQLYQQANSYQEQYERESRMAARRIGKRINSGGMNQVTEDLHGKHVPEVLEMVEEQIRSLPKLFSRGVQVTYITGKGLHSREGAKVRPALVEMLAHHNIQFEERPGIVIATFVPE